MPFAELSGARIFYQQIGRGPDLVFLHGLAANHAFWFTRIAFALKQRYRLTLYDLRGHGRSSMPPSGYTSQQQAEDLAELMDHLRLQDAILVGHSFGGNVALHFATLFPERVRALVVADTRVYALQPVQRLVDRLGEILVQQGLVSEQIVRQLLEEQKHCGLKIGRLFVDKGLASEEQVLGALQRQVQSPNSLEEQLLQGAEIDREEEEHIGLRLLEEWIAQRRTDLPELPGISHVPFGRDSLNSRSAGGFLKLVSSTTAREDFRSMAGLTGERLRQINAPVIGVYGERSRCLPSGLALQSLGYRLQTIRGAGHFHPVTRQQAFLRVLAGFLRNLARDGMLPETGARARRRRVPTAAAREALH